MIKLFNRQKEETDDLILIVQYQHTGSMDVLGQLYGRYMELVYGVCLKIFQDRMKAEDAVMGIFEELVVKLRQHEVTNFKSWLHVLSRNYCLMQLRKNGKLKVEHIDEEFMQIADELHPFFEEPANGKLSSLKPCLEALSQQQRQVVELFYFEKKSYQEIASILGEKVGRVRSHIQNGRRNLKICIEKKNGTNIRK